MYSPTHINDAVLKGRPKTHVFWYRNMAHFAIKLPKYTFPLTGGEALYNRDLHLPCRNEATPHCVWLCVDQLMPLKTD